MSTICQVQQPLFCADAEFGGEADAEFGGEYENYCAGATAGSMVLLAWAQLAWAKRRYAA
jgi:hypothetical protein